MKIISSNVCMQIISILHLFYSELFAYYCNFKLFHAIYGIYAQ
jgi:hypothetical protein